MKIILVKLVVIEKMYKEVYLYILYSNNATNTKHVIKPKYFKI